MSDSEQEINDEMPAPQIKRGRPAGNRIRRNDHAERHKKSAMTKFELHRWSSMLFEKLKKENWQLRRLEIDLKKLLNQRLLCKK